MRLFTCTNHSGHWPVGVASIVVAGSEPRARELLENALLEERLDQFTFTLQEVDLTIEQAIILNNGNY